MQISFVRSGGATPMLRAEGTLRFDDHGANVTSGSTDYRRELGSEEAQKLRSALDSNGLKMLRQYAQKPSQLRDAFQYTIRLTGQDGKMEEFIVHGEPPSPVVQWVQQEADHIWAYLHK